MPTRFQAMFGALFLASGVALLVYIISGVSLLAALALTMAIVLLVGRMLGRRTGNAIRASLNKALLAGAISGTLATLAYDLFRYLLIEVVGFTYWPFDIFSIFGQALVGAGYSGPWVAAAGFGYHVLNGVGFGTAYAVWFGRRGVWAGIAWALVLEGLMVSVYPGWLDLKALDEFLQVSALGHLVYGAVLGYTARWWLERRERTGHVNPGSRP